MFLILEQYFKDYPTKLKIVKGLFEHGISVRNGKLYLNSIEISISEVSKAFSVNRRTVYDTIKLIDSKDELSAVMQNIRPSVDRTGASALMGCEIVTLVPMKGCFSKCLETFMSTTSSYLCHLSEIYAVNENGGENQVRAVFDMPVPQKVFQELEKCSCISKIIIESPDLDSDSYVCPKCEVRKCPKKLVTKIEDSAI